MYVVINNKKNQLINKSHIPYMVNRKAKSLSSWASINHMLVNNQEYSFLWYN